MKLIIALALGFASIASAELPTKFDNFLDTLAKVESSNNPKAYNKRENAIGIYQIRELYFKDAQSFDKSLLFLSHKDCFNPSISKRVVKAYIKKFLPNGTTIEWAMLHNGGCGFKKKTGQAKRNLNRYIRRFNQFSSSAPIR